MSDLEFVGAALRTFQGVVAARVKLDELERVSPQTGAELDDRGRPLVHTSAAFQTTMAQVQVLKARVRELEEFASTRLDALACRYLGSGAGEWSLQFLRELERPHAEGQTLGPSSGPGWVKDLQEHARGGADAFNFQAAMEQRLTQLQRLHVLVRNDADEPKELGGGGVGRTEVPAAPTRANRRRPIRRSA